MAVDINKHNVGSLNSLRVVTVPNVKMSGNEDNWTLVELSYVNGERVATAINAETTDVAYLLCSEEVIYDTERDAFINFYNGDGEYVRVTIIKQGLRFECSNYTGTPVAGHFAHFDTATKKFVIDGATKSGTAKNVFQITDILATEYTLGAACIRLEVQ